MMDVIMDERHLSRAEKANYYWEYCEGHFLIDPEAADRIKCIEGRICELARDRRDLQQERKGLSEREFRLKNRLIVGEEAMLLEELCSDYRISTGVPAEDLVSY